MTTRTNPTPEMRKATMLRHLQSLAIQAVEAQSHLDDLATEWSEDLDAVEPFLELLEGIEHDAGSIRRELEALRREVRR